MEHNISHRISIYDNVLPISLLEKVEVFLKEHGEVLFHNKESYWTDFSGTDSPIEEMVNYLKPFVLNERQLESIIGAEWWVKYENKDDVGHRLHKDIDDKHYLEHKEVRRPDIGTVFYLNSSNGLDGNLVLFTSPSSKSPIYVPPEPNRLVIFDAGNLPHGVTDKNGEIVFENVNNRDKKGYEKSFRICIPINWWSVEINQAKKFKVNHLDRSEV